MPLPSPNLDDRDFRSLLEDARSRIAQAAPEWTDLSPHDPGMVLLELFAYLTETMLYRLNRLPDKVYVELLRLMGVRLQPPAAARAGLRFSREKADDRPLAIPGGTRVAPGRTGGSGEAPLFTTLRPAEIAAGEKHVDVPALHCELIEGEPAGTGTGRPGLEVTLRRPPLIAPTGDPLDLLVGVEAASGELDGRAPARQFQGKTYRIWREVESFTSLGTEPYAYIADRVSGTIVFAPQARSVGEGGLLEESPAALGAVPGAGREIRVWYRRGGGPEGNVAAMALTTLKDALPGVKVTNPEPATGGRAAEMVENALVRGPQHLHSLERAVTARDFELAALRASSAVLRVAAFTRADLWEFAAPGTVEVLLVPYLPEEWRGGGKVTVARLGELQTEDARLQIQRYLDVRRPLGTTCLVNWARYKTVRAQARVVVRREEDPNGVRERILDRLHGAINPLPNKLSPSGWPFGQALRSSHVYDAALAEPGVRWVDRVRLLVEEVPDKGVTSISADSFQAGTWYAAGGSGLFRSVNDGDGWEPVARLEGEAADLVRAHPGVPGLLALVTRLPANAGSKLHISRDSGESWEADTYTTAFQVEDAVWTLREGVPVLLLATGVGLYELALRPDASPVQVLVDQSDQDLGFYALATSVDVRGGLSVAVAAQNAAGVYLSSEGGKPGTFRKIKLQGEDVRTLAVQYDGPRAFLWAGTAAKGPEDNGKGCFRWELRGSQDPPEGWVAFGTGWRGGSCRSLAFAGTGVLAASYHAGVLRLEPGAASPAWEGPDFRCGLPIRDQGRLQPVDTVAANPAGAVLMAGGVEGVYRSTDGGKSYTTASGREFIEKVTLPGTWLFVSGEHRIDVVSEDEAGRD
jgi:hypothetical protein